MKLIIDIDEKTLNRIINTKQISQREEVYLVNSMINGTPLRTGHWIDKGSLSCRCSECGCKSNKETRFCANCGAKMEGDN